MIITFHKTYNFNLNLYLIHCFIDCYCMVEQSEEYKHDVSNLTHIITPFYNFSREGIKGLWAILVLKSKESQCFLFLASILNFRKKSNKSLFDYYVELFRKCTDGTLL